MIYKVYYPQYIYNVYIQRNTHTSVFIQCLGIYNLSRFYHTWMIVSDLDKQYHALNDLSYRIHIEHLYFESYLPIIYIYVYMLHHKHCTSIICTQTLEATKPVLTVPYDIDCLVHGDNLSSLSHMNIIVHYIYIP